MGSVSWEDGVLLMASRLEREHLGKEKQSCPFFERRKCVALSPQELLSPRCRDGPTINFIGHQDAWDLRPELPKFCIPGTQVLIGDFPLDIKYLQRVEDSLDVSKYFTSSRQHTQTGIYKLRSSIFRTGPERN